ncbi:MAG TPA: hypothetical protein VIS76_07505 [Pseudomonadales bacterium]
MNWDAIGAVGETIGAIAVLLTLIVLLGQVRTGNRALAESNRLERSRAIDRHAESIAVWRGRIIENPELAEIWIRAHNDEPLNETELLRANNYFIELGNTQRSNFVRGKTVGEEGLRRQAVLSVAVEATQSHTLGELWQTLRPWMALASTEFVAAVDVEISRIEQEGMGDKTSLPPRLRELLDQRRSAGGHGRERQRT